MRNLRNLNILIIVVLLAGLFSCNSRDELFEREQYKKVFALLSEDGYNVFAEEHKLADAETETTGWVAASCGGSLATEEAISIKMVVDEKVLDRYNKGNYDVDEDKYAHFLSGDRYDIDNPTIIIPAGERTGRMKIRIRANGLSPDSVYLIPLRADTYTAYELNPVKNNVLYRVLLKNYYATQTMTSTATTYNFRGKRDGVNTMGNKQVFPVSGNKVRIMAGDISFESKVSTINDFSIVIEVDNDNKVSITSWKNIDVTQILAGDPDYDPQYPNIFRIDDDGYKTYKTFLLQYKYVQNGTTHVMQEELKLEFNKKTENY
ncbi:hypothetical protein EZS27_009538 [termite gut metagenome]|uniref:DUF4361 domain-containing protein n=1 Tax=termite gut metagenome TaxID=433724 RepID=A0A5J4SBB7_9ZZZZ